jgi:hypothetical protein
VAIPALRERDILLTNMQRVAGPVMAEHVMAMMLAYARGLHFYIPERMAGRWTREMPAPGRMLTLEGKTVLVVGLGGIGVEVAKRAHALGMRVVATRASGREGPAFVSYVGLPDELEKLAAEADFVVNTAPLTPATAKRPSCSSASSTPQVNAPCAPPPCRPSCTPGRWGGRPCKARSHWRGWGRCIQSTPVGGGAVLQTGACCHFCRIWRGQRRAT